MATGFATRFKGKIKASQLWLDSDGLYDAASGIAGFPLFVQKIALPVTAVAATYFVASAPPGKTLLRATVYTTTAYTGTGVTIALGVSQGDASYVAATSIKALGVAALTLVAAAAGGLGSLPAAPNIYIDVAQSGTATAVGAATLVLEYA